MIAKMRGKPERVMQQRWSVHLSQDGYLNKCYGMTCNKEGMYRKFSAATESHCKNEAAAAAEELQMASSTVVPMIMSYDPALLAAAAASVAAAASNASGDSE